MAKKIKLGPLDNLDDVEEALKEYYTAGADGKFILSNAEYNFGAVKALKDECGARRISEKQVKDKLSETESKLSLWGEHTPDIVLPQLDRITELEAASKGKVPEEKLTELAEQRARALLVPVEKKLKEAVDRLAAAEAKNVAYDQAQKRSQVLAEVATHAGELGFEEKTFSKPNGALNLIALSSFRVDESGQVVATDTSGFTPGVAAKDVLPDLLAQHPYLGKPSAGGGSTGSGSQSSGGAQNVFTQNNMSVRAQLAKSNPVEYEKQFKASGMAGKFQQYVAKT